MEKLLRTSKGFSYPAQIEDNRIWRTRIYAGAMRDPVAQQAWMSLASSDVEGFIATFLWTYRQDTATALTPFTPWEHQLKLIRELNSAIEEQYDLFIEKSRREGATWICLGVGLHKWLFRPDVACMLLSRTEDLVDKRGNPDSLFTKLDYALEHLPAWMRPPVDPKKDRTHMHLANPRTGSVFDGEATGANPGRGGRRRWIMLDEAGAMDDFEAVLAATADNAACRIFNTTPSPNPMAMELRMSGKVKVFSMPWWHNPEKNAGAYCWKDGALDRLDGDYEYQEGYPYIKDGKLRSPWYDFETGRRASLREIAQEIDVNWLRAGERVFDIPILQQIRDRDCRPAAAVGEVLCVYDAAKSKLGGPIWRRDHGKRRVKLWCPIGALGKPSVQVNYVLGVDISSGQGASNSVISVLCRDTGEKVAEFCDSMISPEDLARYAVGMSRWFSGANGHGFLVWEANGNGLIFGKEVGRLGYSFVYFQRDELSAWPRRGRRPGWFSNRRSKEYLLSDYRRALARGEFLNRCEESIEEAMRYVFLPSGAIGPQKIATMDSAAKANHADRVIADALCQLGAQEQPKAPQQEIPAPRSFAERRLLARAAAKKDGWSP